MASRLGAGLFLTLCLGVGCSAANGADDGDMGADTGSAGGSGGAIMGSGGSGGLSSTGGASVGGAVSTGGSTGSGGTGGTSGGCESATICDDFEDGIDAAWAIQMDSTPPPSVDTAKGANGSSSSLKVTGSSQQSFIVLDVPGQDFYARAYMQFQNATSAISGHGWFIVGADNATQGGGNQIRFGASGNHGHTETDVNVYGDTCGGEKTQFSDGASDGLQGWTNTTDEILNFDAGVWYCVEVHFNGPANDLTVSVRGPTDASAASHEGLHVTESTMCVGWSPTYTKIKFGAGANGNIGDVWYDDVAVSTSPIGCN